MHDSLGNPIQAQQPRAVVSAPPIVQKAALISSFKFTASSGLVAGIVVGFVLLSGSSDSAQAVTSPGDTGQSEIELAAAVPEETTPEKTAPDEIVPETMPDETMPEETAPDETPPDPDINKTAVASAITTKEDGAENLAPPTLAPEDVGLTFSVAFDIRPVILRDTLQMTVNGETHDPRSFFSLALKRGAKSKRVTVTAKVDGYRDFKKSQVIRGDDFFIIQLKEKPISAKPASSDSKTAKSKSTKPKSDKTDKPRKPRKPRKPKNGPGSLISL